MHVKVCWASGDFRKMSVSVQNLRGRHNAPLSSIRMTNDVKYTDNIKRCKPADIVW